MKQLLTALIVMNMIQALLLSIIAMNTVGGAHASASVQSVKLVDFAYTMTSRPLPVTCK